MTREEFVPEFLRFISDYDQYIIAGHVKPDGDCIGASIALGLALKARGKKVSVYYDGDTARYGAVPEYVPSVTQETAEAVMEGGYALILLDLADPARTGSGSFLMEKAVDTLCIDHHVNNGVYARINHIEEGLSSTCEILYHLLKLAEIPITQPMAEVLYMGVAFDTGGFRHSYTTGDTYRMAGELVDLGAPCTQIMNHLYHEKHFKEIKILSAVYRKARLYKEGFLLACMESRDFLKLGASPDDADNVIGSLAEVAEAEVVVYMKEVEPDVFRVSLRSKEYVDVAAIAGKFGGGGHVRAAGCTIKEQGLLAKMLLMRAIKEQLR